MFCALVDKYGVVPKDAMPETECSSNTREMDKFLTLKLREYACKLRAMHAEGKSAQELAGEKEAMLSTIYRMLCICWASRLRPSRSKCATRTTSSSATPA